MLLQSKSNKNTWSKRDLQIITKYRQRIKDIEQLNLQQKILNKDINSVDFYRITPKQQLPKFLQKMKFQTLHSKQNVSKVVKVFKKERQTVQQSKIRKKLRNQGEIMFLSEIYQNLGQYTDPSKTQNISIQAIKFIQNYGTDLQQWQKNKNNSLLQKILIMKKRTNNHQSSPRHRQSRIIQQKLSQLHRKNSNGRIINYFKQGSNYKKQIQKQLDIIYYTHSSQTNQVNKYVLVQNSSKLLKKQLDERKLQVQQEIKSKLKILNQTRIQHHNLFQEKCRLTLEQRQYLEQLSTKEQYGLTLNNNTSYFTSAMTNSSSNSSKLSDLKIQKRTQLEQNEIKIIKNKRLIQTLENGIQNSEDQLRSIMVGEISYYKTSLKIGVDCRDSGLGWILKRLRSLLGGGNVGSSGSKETEKEKEMIVMNGFGGVNGQSSSNNSSLNNNQLCTTNLPFTTCNLGIKQQQYQFPLYLDKKSKQFLIVKTQLQDQLEQLLQQKRKFVNEIGQQSSSSEHPAESRNSKLIMNRTTGSGNGWVGKEQDRIVEEQEGGNGGDIPKKYRRSLRKITLLNQQYAKNQALLMQFKPRIQQSPIKNVDLSSQTQGLTGKRLYQTISQKIKFFDFTKAKKDKSHQLKNKKLLQYQNLLNLIKQIHIKMQDLDIQQQNHLINHYKQNKEIFFQQCAACFGYKKSYTMIIKYFSWKSNNSNSHDEHNNNV